MDGKRVADIWDARTLIYRGLRDGTVHCLDNITVGGQS